MNRLKELFNLDNRTIIVAGGAGQIGFGFCEILVEAGAKVAIADIDIDLAKDKWSKLPEELKRNISFYYLDVSKREEVLKTMAKIKSELGEIYGLINSFHYKGNTRKLDTSSNFFVEFESYPEKAWDMVHDVNLKGSFLLSQSIIPYLRENGGGVIVNVSSTYGNVSANKNIYGNSGINSPVAYATSKAAIINFSRYLATHLAEYNIRVNTLSPGGVFNNQSDEFIRNYIQLTPIGRMADAKDYQGAILYLMSDASSYMTGSNLIVDGGWTAW